MRQVSNNKVIFVNGKIGFGSPPSGEGFWSENFVRGALDFFPENNHCFYVSSDYGYKDDNLIRYKEGQEYARTHFDELTTGMQKRLNAFRIVAHSMGCAFAEGIKYVLSSEGWEVDYCVHINPWQPGTLHTVECENCFVISYQNTDDPLKYILTNKKGTIKGADLTIQEPSGYKWYQVLYIHRSPIHKGRSFWKMLENALPEKHSLIGS